MTTAPIKDPNDWTTGDEPATAAQLSYLEALSQETGKEIPENISKSDASKLIEEMRGDSDRVDTEKTD